MPRWFLYLNGAALAVMGAMMFAQRVRERPLHRQLLGLLWATLCMGVGGALLLMGRGYLDTPGGLHRNASGLPERKPMPELPTGR
jgi:hypothetical protein